MRQIAKWLAVIVPVLGCLLTAYMIFGSYIEITISNPFKTTRYDIFSLITSNDFDQYPYSKIGIDMRICPLISTTLLAAATVLSAFYKSKKCAILSGIIFIIAGVSLLILNLNNFSPKPISTNENLLVIASTMYFVAYLSPIMCSFTLSTHIRYRQENDLGPII